MKFEEQFPSLKDKVFRDSQGFDMVTDFNIQECCLDKQKVKDAINKLAEEVFIGVDSDGDDRFTEMIKPKYLLKALGLEK